MLCKGVLFINKIMYRLYIIININSIDICNVCIRIRFKAFFLIKRKAYAIIVSKEKCIIILNYEICSNLYS